MNKFVQSEKMISPIYYHGQRPKYSGQEFHLKINVNIRKRVPMRIRYMTYNNIMNYVMRPVWVYKKSRTNLTKVKLTKMQYNIDMMRVQ